MTGTRQDRQPVIVGVGQLRSNRARTVDGAREPLALAVEALRAAEADAGVRGLLASVDAVSGVGVSSWAYQAWASSVAQAVGARPRTLVDTGLGGHHPARLLDDAAARIRDGDSEVAVVVGAEAQASVGVLARAGVEPDWSRSPGGGVPLDFSTLGSPASRAAGLYLPTRVYPLYENRLQADLGLTPEQGAAWSARIYADLSLVASRNPAAWDPEVRTPQQVGGRMVCEPYPLGVNAMPHVDQAAAVVLTSRGRARSLGVPDDHLVHVRGGAGADDHPDPLRRSGFGSSAALSRCLDAALGATGLTPGDLDLIDVYSCFPVVPKLAGLHLGLADDAVLSVAGGHSSFGGPLNSYALHAAATMVQRLRGGAGVGLVHANGGFLSYQHAVVLTGRAHPDGYVGRPAPERVEHPDAPAPGEVSDGLEVVVETCTVEHARTGGPQQAFLVGRTDGGERVSACTRAGDACAAEVLSLAALSAGVPSHVGRRVRLAVRDGGVEVVPVPG